MKQKILQTALILLLAACGSQENSDKTLASQKTSKEDAPQVHAKAAKEDLPTKEEETKPVKEEVKAPETPKEEPKRWVKVSDDKVYLRGGPSNKDKFVGLARPMSPLPVYEEVKGGAKDSCKLWLRVGDMSFPGYVCSSQVSKSSAPPAVVEDPKDPTSRNGFSYAILIKDEHLYDSPNGKPLETLRNTESYVTVQGERIVGKDTWLKVAGGWLPKSATRAASAKGISALRGEILPEGTKLPWVFVVAKDAKVFANPGDTTGEIGTVKRFERFPVLETVELEDTTPIKPVKGKTDVPPAERPKLKWARTELGWLEGKKLDWALQQPRPEGVSETDKWIFVDIEQQTLVAYEGDKPVFTTLFSSGRAPNLTVTGLFHIHRVYRTHTMENAPGGTEESYYYVADIPYTMFFHKTFAIHGTFWHDNFGFTRSHGCVNVTPADAKWIFDWINPQIPLGWWGLALEEEDAAKAGWVTVQVKWGDRVVKAEDVTNPGANKIIEQMRALREQKEKDAASQPANGTAPKTPEVAPKTPEVTPKNPETPKPSSAPTKI
jgi:lipoprotein-anchoring transpeptidase ErfK/SrfK